MDAVAPPGPGQSRVTRLTNADARHTLEQLKSSPVLAEGKVCVVGLDAIREQMGERWPSRSQMVYDYFRRTVERHLKPHDFHLRISETDYLVTQPGVSRLAGQAYCLNCLREVLHHFLGEALTPNIRVREITEIGDGEVTGRTLDVGAVEEAEITERAGRASAAGPGAVSQDRWSPFVAADGRRLRASVQLEPVFQLRTYARIGYRMIRSAVEMPGDVPLSPAEHRKLASTDIERIDFATLSRGLNRLQQDADGALQPGLILPVSFVTLSSIRGRAVLVNFFRDAQSRVQQGLICEVCDIAGVPPSALLAATSLIKPFCRFVIARLDPAQMIGLSALKDTGLQGLSIERPAAVDSDAEFTTFAQAALTAARPVAKTLMIYGLVGARHAAIAGFLGVTHGSFAAARPKVRDLEEAQASA